MSLLVADAYPNFSICGLPYYLSGDVGDWRSLAHRTTSDLEQAGLRLLLDHSAQAIDPAAKQVTVHGRRQLGYDRLVIGTGAVAVRPPIDGLDLPGVHVLHTMADTFALHRALAAGAGSAVTVGGGYIGLEMAEAFCARGLTVTVVEQAPALMPTVDLELGRLLGEELRRHDVQVVNDVTVKAIHPDTGADRGRRAQLRRDRRPRPGGGRGPPRDRPGRGRRGADRRPRGHPGRPAHAHQPPRYPGRRRLCRDLPSPPRPARLPAARHHRPQAGPGRRRDRPRRHATFAGSLGTQVAKRIDIPATALFHHMPVEGLGELDLSYTPPFGSPWDAVQMAAQTWTRQVRGGQPTQGASHKTRR